MIRIEIGRRHYLLYLLLPHPLKSRLLTAGSRAKLERINRSFNDTIYSGTGASAYDEIHRYAEDEQHEYPARPLVDRVWPGAAGYGRALEVGAGSGYFTTLIARHARSVLALEPVADMQAVLEARCRTDGVDNVKVLGVPASALAEAVPAASVDTAFIIQSLHHLHDRSEVFRALGHVVKPGGRLLMVEPHHNLRRAARLFRKYLTTYRAREFWSDERNWATHDFLTRGELRALCRQGGFDRPRFSGYWIPYSRRFVPDAERRFQLEGRLGRWPVFRHWASVLAVEAR
ncbi:MAG TPA: methyltransferase domain-containing protein, partial [Candidatus Dormibacteraeota bacterium]|nr:methyltransferase domain-containing protein [Candidatus Dormibacteraeota bacterium]